MHFFVIIPPMEKKEVLSLADYVGQEGGGLLSSGDALPQFPVVADYVSSKEKRSLFENFVADGQAIGLNEEDLSFTKTVMDSFEAIFQNPNYAEGTPTRKKFDSFLLAFDLGSKYIRQANEGLSDGRIVSFNQNSVFNGEAPYVDNMIKMLGANFYVDRMIREQVELARQNDAGDYMELAGEAFVENSLVLISREEDGFSLRDFKEPDSIISTGRLADAIGFIFKGYDAPEDETEEQSSEYQVRDVLQSYLAVFSFLKKDALRNYRGGSQVEGESYKQAALFLDSMNRLREESQKAIFDIKHPDHVGISRVVSRALDTPESKDLMLLYLMKSVEALYRDAKTLSEVEENSLVAELILGAIDSMIEEKGVNLIKAQDLSEIGAQELEEEPDYAVLRKQANEIFSYTSTLEYELKGCEIDSDLVVAPSQVHVRFEKGKPHMFEIELYYENEYGEESSVDYAIDSKRENFEWSLLDDSEKEAGYKNTFLKYSEGVMLAVLEKAKLIKASKKKGAEITVVPSAKPHRKGVSIGPKRAPFEFRNNAKPTSAVFTEFGSSHNEQGGIHREVIIPKDEELERRLKSLDPEDRKIVVARLEALNEGAGRIEALRKDGKPRKSSEGNHLGKIVVTGKNGGARGIRVLVERTMTMKGREVWDVVTGNYRGKIYDDTNLDRI